MIEWRLKQLINTYMKQIMVICCVLVLFLGSSNLPPPDIFGKSLYTFYIGQNDFTSDLAKIGVGGVKQKLPQVISQITGTIKASRTLKPSLS